MSAAKKAATVTRGAPAPAVEHSAGLRPGPGGAAPRAAERPSTTSASAAPGQVSLSGSSQTPTRPAAARRVRLTVSRVDPWSAMKLSFLLSVALGIAGVVMTGVMWMVLAGMGVFDKINSVVGTLVQTDGTPFDIMNFVGFGRVVSLAIVIAVVDVVLLTAISTLGAFIYNVSANLVGGLHLTLTDD